MDTLSRPTHGDTLLISQGELLSTSWTQDLEGFINHSHRVVGTTSAEVILVTGRIFFDLLAAVPHVLAQEQSISENLRAELIEKGVEPPYDHLEADAFMVTFEGIGEGAPRIKSVHLYGKMVTEGKVYKRRRLMNVYTALTFPPELCPLLAGVPDNQALFTWTF